MRRTPPRDPGRGQPHLLRSARLALGTASALGFARFAYGLLVPAMRGELHWNLAQSGTLTTANALGYLLGAVITTPVARRLGVTATFRLGMVLTAAALAANAATDGYTILLLTRAAAGLSGGLVFIAGGVLASRAAAHARSAAPLAIYCSGSGLGIALSGAAIPPLLGGHPGRWPLAWAGLAAAAGLAALISWTAAADNRSAGTSGDLGTGTSDDPRGSGIGLRAVACLWPTAASYLLFAAGSIAYITYLSAYLTAHHAGTAAVALIWAVLGAAAVAAPAAWARPIGTWPGTSALATLLALIAAAAALALVSADPAAVTGSAIGYGATFLGVPAAITALIRTTTPESDLTAVIAAFTVVFGAGQTVGPYLSGLLADRYGVGATLAWTAALCTAGALLSLLTLTRYPGAGGTADRTVASQPEYRP